MRGFTLLEMLIVLLIISITVTFVSPMWQQTNTQTILNKEQQKLYLFLRYIQTRVENSNDIWFLIPNRDLNKKTWCITAQIKSDKLCDCLLPQTCSKDVMHIFIILIFLKKLC